jgi:type VI secretion system protein ImpK
VKENRLEQMYWVCADAIALATQLGTAPDLPAPEVLRQRINATFDALNNRASQMGIPAGDAMEAIYALAAFMDEQILRSPWPARQQWMAQPLQLVYFRENTAGEGFFNRLAALEADPERAHVVQIYFLCMALGFRGKYAVASPAELASVQERTANQLSRSLPATETFSPSGYPQSQRLNLSAKQFPMVAVALGFFALSILLFVVLIVTTSSSADNAASRIRAKASADPKAQQGEL